MDIFVEYAKLTESELFADFMSQTGEFYLAHIYQMLGKDDSTSLEFGFYSKITDRIVVFETNPIRKRDEEEVFKEAETIMPLRLETVKISMDDALAISEKACKEKYPSEIVHKKIVLLQNIEQQVWNITLISLSFNIINIRIDAETGEVVNINIHSIMDLGTRS
jgi:hypothetical protein